MYRLSGISLPSNDACVKHRIMVGYSAVHAQEKFTESYRFENMTFTFDCSNRAVGFYADPEYDCQIFHMCNGDGKRIPHVCANETSFNQEFRICDWEYNFDCSQAEKWYYLNELTYMTDSSQDEDIVE
ncbi:hypothetical protein PPYR_01700 [Photinus pyralis]|uniref:Chitin-binding type-2 domain-containing protein n=1 Tax=Photinus pyralis TaxID=7054 RepID=A0A5N4B5U8_PHOPY|nr:hypothetical protein PPYR_01700 [Photinus pyralis]